MRRAVLRRAVPHGVLAGARAELRRVLAVARADLRRRRRSRRTLAVVVAVATLGLVWGVEGFRLVFRRGDEVHYVGRSTAAVVGLEAGVAAAYLVVLGGYFLLRGRLRADHRLGVTRVTATTPVSNAAVLLGKWLSHVAVLSVAVLGFALAATVTHARSGVGATDPLAVVVPVVLFGLPAAGLVAGVTLLFESTATLSGTLGSVAYLGAVLAAGLLGVSTHAGGAVPPLVAATDLYGTVAAGRATADAVTAAAPQYAGGSPGLFTRFLGLPTGTTRTFDYAGGGLPAWVFLQRAGLLAVGAGLALAAAVPYDRWRPATDDDPGRLRRLRRLAGRVRRQVAGPVLRGADSGDTPSRADDGDVADDHADAAVADTPTDTVAADDHDHTVAADTPADAVGANDHADAVGANDHDDAVAANDHDHTVAANDHDHTVAANDHDDAVGANDHDDAVAAAPSVTRRRPASVLRLFAHELRGTLRGQPWWWYLGVIVFVGGASLPFPRRQFVALALAWPVFVWSSLGVQSTHRPRAALIAASPSADRQLFAEWAAGVCVAAVVCLPAVLVSGADAGLAGAVADGRLLAAATAVTLPPSVALAAGVLTGTPRVFEGGYLLVWYVGPLNVPALDFAGASPTALSTGAPGPFLVVAAVALAAAVAGRRVHRG